MTALCLAQAAAGPRCGGLLRGRKLSTAARPSLPLQLPRCPAPGAAAAAGGRASCVRVLAFRLGRDNKPSSPPSPSPDSASGTGLPQPPEVESIRDIDSMLGRRPKITGGDAEDDNSGSSSGNEAERAEEARVRREEAFREVLRPPPSGYREPTDEIMAQARAEADAEEVERAAAANNLLAALGSDPRTRDVARAAGRSLQGVQQWWAGVPDKRLVVAEVAALAVAAYLGAAVLGALERVPLLPQALEAVGLAYSSYFWWRFILFADGRAQLRAALGRAQARVAESVSDLADAAADSAAAAAAAGRDVRAVFASTSTADSDDHEDESGGGGGGGGGGAVRGGGWRGRGGAAMIAAGAAARAAATTARGVVEAIAARHHDQRHLQRHHSHHHLLNRHHSYSHSQSPSYRHSGGGGGASHPEQDAPEAAAARARARQGGGGGAGGEDSTQAYVQGLLQELDDRTARLHDTTSAVQPNRTSAPTTTPWATEEAAELQQQQRRDVNTGGGPATGGGRGGPPAVFALLLLSAGAAVGGHEGVLMARHRGPEEVEAMNGIPRPDDPQSAAGAGGSTDAADAADAVDAASLQAQARSPPTPTPRSPQEAEAAVMGLDPCLGWDTEACAATGHLRLDQPDMAKLEALAEQAARQARRATGFSRQVDRSLHALDRSRSASTEEGGLEGEHGRAAGALEREVMEELAKRPDAALPHPRSKRHPAMGEESGTGP
ncbi:hypothetical protein HXX76_012470 [Chlamydomonas incerta]|uniref:Cyanobacterial aminoacyl-tRNA synthetase CAAD domain-containing protein n=1 Tax=Chlamydomonas incerta TaxID=51695 RepID=A0A835VVQ8_CHLIN|nr:hypothetical protein HXX76_012470 [Chlamydomonas incerta]|eukprot:KAG2427274.1 hypothetical protein HXX76_012470 [Chlamydomonas incerta]